MANEVHIDYRSGETLYGVVFDSAGQVNVNGGNTFEDWGSNGHDADDYDFSISEVGSGGTHYTGDFPVGITKVDRFTIVVFVQSGANPADGDEILGSGELIWNGSVEEHIIVEALNKAIKLLTNKAVQNKITGAIDYYDDDGQIVILTHTPTDSESTLTRTPS